MLAPSKLIASLVLLRPLPTYRACPSARLALALALSMAEWRTVAPFAALYALAAALWWQAEDALLPGVAVGVLLAVHSLTVLLGIWFVAVRTLLYYAPAVDLEHAAYVHVHPRSHKGVALLCPLVRRGGGTHFIYQQRTYAWTGERFEKLVPTLQRSFGEYAQEAQAQARDDTWAATETLRWGGNALDIPLPSFADLYKEQMVAPFFVFQVFTVGLWMLDEYWQYAVFILVMLLMLEGTVVASRRRNLAQLRSMLPVPFDVRVLRNRAWCELKSSALLPGDVIQVPEGSVPADLLLLTGGCVVNEAMLTGESTPQRKEAPSASEAATVLNLKEHAEHILWAGTQTLQVTGDSRSRQFGKAPDSAPLAVVLRTGFETSQGKLLRTILYSTQRVTANTSESFLFIACLLAFAVAAASYVLREGLRDPLRSRYKLFVDCALILTSVVPPELPTELTLAVNTSLLRLQKVGVFCTEPFRIPLAGKVDVCVFDKTGTLTAEHLILSGVSVSGTLLTPAETTATDSNDGVHSTLVLAACHGLSLSREGVAVGDPLEVAALRAIGWTFGSNDSLAGHCGDGKAQVSILRRHAFHSQLARMAVVVRVRRKGVDGQSLALVKGAPEVIESLLKVVPPAYKATYDLYARQGKRVLALAWREIPEKGKDWHRDDVEKELFFAGFAVFACPLKPDTLSSLRELHESAHVLMMLTGDHHLTACHVARELNMTARPLLILHYEDTGDASWTPLPGDDGDVVPFEASASAIDTLGLTNTFCLLGRSLPRVLALEHGALRSLLRHTRVIARASPAQKSAVVAALKGTGSTVMMVGDGTNDVGALKIAHVGVAVLNSAAEKKKEPPIPRSAAPNVEESRRGDSAPVDRRGKGLPRERRQKRPAPPSAAVALTAALEEADEPTVVALGDASIASPFTARGASLRRIGDVVRQGRCTLVTTYQMFRILALTCLVNAYSLSVLALAGIKMGDTQMTVTGLLLALCFLFVTRSAPRQALSAKRPLPRLFTPYLVISVLGQFAVHLVALITLVAAAEEHRVGERPTPDADFAPNLVNSVVFLLTTAMQIVTFAVNYEGHPFMESLLENKGLAASLAACVAIVATAALEVVPVFNASFDMVPLPPSLSPRLLWTLLLDAIGAFLVERVARVAFYR